MAVPPLASQLGRKMQTRACAVSSEVEIEENSETELRDRVEVNSEIEVNASQEWLESKSGIDDWVHSEEATWLKFLEEEAKLSCRDPRIAKDKQLCGVARANPDDVQIQLKCKFTDGRGIATLLQNRTTQYLILFLSVFYFLVFGGSCYALLSERSVHGQVFKFEVVDDLELEDHNHLALMYKIADIGLIFDACEIGGGSRYHENNVITVEFAHPVSVDGWYVKSNIFITANFRVFWSAGQGSPFQTLESPRNFLSGFESMFALSSTWNIELKGQERTEVTILPCLPCAIVSTIMWFALGACCGLTSTGALMAKPCSEVAAVGLSAGVLTILSWSFIFVRLQDSQPGIETTLPTWRGAITSTLLAPHLIYNIWPKQLFATVILSTCLHLALVCMAMVQQEDNSEYNGLLLLLLRSHEVCVCVGCLVLVVTRIAQQKQAYQLALESVQEAKDRLDQVWLNTLVLLETKEPDTLKTLAQIVQNARQGTSRTPVQRILQPLRPSLLDLRDGDEPSYPRALLWDNIKRMKDSSPGVQGLDQLYTQGRLCSKLLRERVQKLAFECKGMFPITRTKQTTYEESALYILWEEADDFEEVRDSIQWTPLKPLEQAKSKVLDHYNGDVSRLLDICRETVVFKEVEEITRCLHAVLEDREFVVERIKNTLTLSCASKHASCYRGVLLNLRIDTPASRTLGVSGFRKLRKAGDARDRATVHHYLPQLRCNQNRPEDNSWRLTPNGETWHNCVGTVGTAPNYEVTAEMRVGSMRNTPFRVSSHTSGFSQEDDLEFTDTSMLLRIRPGSTSSSQEVIPSRAMSAYSGPDGLWSRRHLPRKRDDLPWHPILTRTTNASPSSCSLRLQSDQDNVMRLRLEELELESGQPRPGTQVEQETPQGMLQERMVMRVQSVNGINVFRAKILIEDARSRETKSGHGTAVTGVARDATGSILNEFPQLTADPIGRDGSMEAGAAENRDSSPADENMFLSLRTRAASVCRPRSAPLEEQYSLGLPLQPRGAGQGLWLEPQPEASGTVTHSGETLTREATLSRESDSNASRANWRAASRSGSDMPPFQTTIEAVPIPSPTMGMRPCSTCEPRESRISEWTRYMKAKGVSFLEPRASQTKHPVLSSEPEVDWGEGKGVWYLTMQKHFQEKSFGTRPNFESKDTIAAAVTDADYFNVFQTSYPIQAALCKSWFRHMSLALFVAYLAAVAFALLRVDTVDGVEVSRVRFVSTQQRGNLDAKHKLLTSVGAMGVWIDDCRLDLITEQHVDNEWVMQLEEPAIVDGFFWHTSQDTAEHDPVSFKILVSADGEEWKVAAASQRELHFSGSQEWHANPFATPLQRNALVDIDFHAPWFLWLDPTVSNLLLACTWLSLYVCSWCQRHRIAERRLESTGNGIDQWLLAGRRLFVAGFTLNAICLQIKIGAIIRHSHFEHIIEHSLHTLSASWIAVCAARFPKRSMEALVFDASVKVVMLLVHTGRVQNVLEIRTFCETGAPPMVVMIYTVLLVLQHARSKRISQLKVAQDVAGYERAWETIMGDAGETLGIQALSETEDKIIHEYALFQAVQLQRYHPMSPLMSSRVEDGRKQRQKAQKRMLHDSPKLSESKLLAFPPSTPRLTPSPGSPAVALIAARPKRTSTSSTSWSRANLRSAGSPAPENSDSATANNTPRMVLSLFPRKSFRRHSNFPSVMGDPSLGQTRSRTKHSQGTIRVASNHDDASGTPAGLQLDSEVSQSCSPARPEMPAVSLSSLFVYDRPSHDTEQGAFAGQLSPHAPSSSWLPVVPPLHEEPESTHLAQQRVASDDASSMVSPDSGSSARLPRSERRILTPKKTTSDHQRHNSIHAFSGPDAAGSGAGTPTQTILWAQSAPMSPSEPRCAVARARPGGASESPEACASRRRTAWSRFALSVTRPRKRTGRLGASAISAVRTVSQVASSIGHHLAAVSLQTRVLLSHSSQRLEQLTRGDGEGGGELVDSLDLLYSQAELLHPVLKMKVQRWAALSEGCFPLREGDGKLANWQFLVDRHGSEAAAEAQVKWASVKGLARAKEKLVRSYQGRASRLLDLCRQSIVFKSTRRLAECLQHIADDPDVIMVSVKNRLHGRYDAKAKSMGYRDVNLSLRFSSAKTSWLGVDLHICEVQLLLAPFANLKSTDGHKRYIAWRNCQAR